MPDRISEGRRGWARTSAVGASCPFRLVLANVPSPNPQQPFAAGDNLLGQAARGVLRATFSKDPSQTSVLLARSADLREVGICCGFQGAGSDLQSGERG